MSVTRLYTPEVLAATVELAAYPLDANLTLRGEARSASCGSRLELGLALGIDGRIARTGIAARACAIGQASAAIFAAGVVGCTPQDVIDAHGAIARWLAGAGAMPGWPRLALVAPAAAYPARHGAMLLPWVAAIRALEQGNPARHDATDGLASAAPTD